MENEFQNSAQQSGENQINKKKSPLPIVIAIAVILIAVVSICYFAFFSEAAMRDREIKNLIASAEKYLDDLDYENAIAEYEAILKLDPKAEDVLDDYVGTVLAYSKEVAETDPEEAADILSDAAEFLDKISDGDKDIEEQAEKLSDMADEYQAIADEANQEEDETGDVEDDSEDEIDDSDVEETQEDEYCNFTVSEEDVSVTCDGRYFEISLATNGIQDMYLMDSNDIEISWMEYIWSVDFTTDGENHLSVASTHFKSGDEEYYDDFYSMQHNLWDVDDDGGGASSVMFIDVRLDGNTIIWSFDLPEEYKITEDGFSIITYDNTGAIY